MPTRPVPLAVRSARTTKTSAATTATTGPAAAGDARGAWVPEGRRLILDTAARRFKDVGFAGTSLRDIAAACGMQPASLYYHFSSKDEIVGEVLRIGVEQVHAEVRRAVDALPPDAGARAVLGAAVRAHLQALLGLQDYTSANVRIFGQVPPAVRQAHIATRDRYERYWVALLQRCARVGGFDPARNLRLARLFMIGALNGSLEWFRGSGASLNRVADELTHLVLQGLVSRRHEVTPTPHAKGAPRRATPTPHADGAPHHATPTPHADGAPHQGTPAPHATGAPRKPAPRGAARRRGGNP